MLSAAAALALAAMSVGSLHSLAPDHWVPFTALARAQGWSRRRTALVTLLCGFGHVTVSVALGVAGLLLGSAALQALGQKLEAVAGILLVGFGLAYAVWGLRKAVLERLHGHHHSHDVSRPTAWTLFLLFSADPCVAVIPIVFAAAPLGVAPAVAVVGAYEVATLGTMVGLVLLSLAGVRSLRAPWLDRYGDGAAGGLIAATGLVLMALGL
jgi:hypothetical protein